MKPLILTEPLTEAHAALLFPSVADPALYTYIPGEPPVTIEALALEYRRLAQGSPDPNQTWLNWVALHSGVPVGTLQATVLEGGRATIGYIIFRRYWGRGFASQGCRWLIRELFERRGLSSVWAYVDPRNVSSLRVVAAAGLSPLPEGATSGDGDERDAVFVLSAAEWRCGQLG